MLFIKFNKGKKGKKKIKLNLSRSLKTTLTLIKLVLIASTFALTYS
jgi:hypothetical protein